MSASCNQVLKHSGHGSPAVRVRPPGWARLDARDHCGGGKASGVARDGEDAVHPAHPWGGPLQHGQRVQRQRGNEHQNAQPTAPLEGFPVVCGIHTEEDEASGCAWWEHPDSLCRRRRVVQPVHPTMCRYHHHVSCVGMDRSIEQCPGWMRRKTLHGDPPAEGPPSADSHGCGFQNSCCMCRNSACWMCLAKPSIRLPESHMGSGCNPGS